MWIALMAIQFRFSSSANITTTREKPTTRGPFRFGNTQNTLLVTRRTGWQVGVGPNKEGTSWNTAAPKQTMLVLLFMTHSSDAKGFDTVLGTGVPQYVGIGTDSLTRIDISCGE